MASLMAAGVALRAPKRDAAQPPAGPVVVTPTTDAPPLAGHVPTGAPPSLTCERARAVVAQVDALLVERPHDIDEVAFGEGVVDWLDPHGLWSAAPGAPAGDMLRKEAGRLLNALRGKEACAVAAALGVVLWVTGAGYAYPSGSTFAELVRDKVDAGIITRVREGDHLCLRKEPWTFLYAAPFHGQKRYAVREVERREDCGDHRWEE